MRATGAGARSECLLAIRRTEVRAVRVVYQGRRSSAVLPLVLNWADGRSDGKAPLALAALFLGAGLVVSVSAEAPVAASDLRAQSSRF